MIYPGTPAATGSSSPTGGSSTQAFRVATGVEHQYVASAPWPTAPDEEEFCVQKTALASTCEVATQTLRPRVQQRYWDWRMQSLRVACEQRGIIVPRLKTDTIQALLEDDQIRVHSLAVTS